MLTYNIQFDGTQYAFEIQNADKDLAAKILILLENPAPFGKPDPKTTPTYRSEAERAFRMFPDHKINAIKEMRTRTFLGLKEAKDCIDYAFGSSSFQPNYYNDLVTNKG